MFVAESETYRAALKRRAAGRGAAPARGTYRQSMLATFSFASGRARALALEQAAAAGDLADAPEALAAAVDADIALLAEALADEGGLTRQAQAARGVGGRCCLPGRCRATAPAAAL